jgi:hypothetical protein
MKKPSLYLVAFCASFGVPCLAQDITPHIQAMKTSYAASGSIAVLENGKLLIEPNMPGPLCALPKTENGKTSWMFYSFPLASITLPLADVDESLIADDTVFTAPDAPRSYKPGDTGDTTMVVIVGLPGRQFHTLIYDRDKLTHLGPGPHSSNAYGQAPDDTAAFGLTFPNHASALAFETALRNAVILAKRQTVAQAHPPR